MKRISLKTHGRTRDVFLIGNFAIKIPTWRNGQCFLLEGMIGNLRERNLWKCCPHEQLAQQYLCLPFGLMAIYRRYDNQLKALSLTLEQRNSLPIENPDYGTTNYAVLDDGRLVVLDYGHCDAYYKPEAYEQIGLSKNG